MCLRTVINRMRLKIELKNIISNQKAIMYHLSCRGGQLKSTESTVIKFKEIESRRNKIIKILDNE